ncbi:hypothetical protein ACV7JQ_07015 [Globicatella sulfidifaciens]
MRNGDLIHKGITYLGKHSFRDYGLTIASRDIGYPDKIKNKIQPPYSNTEYDFSLIFGSQNYSPRQVTYQFNIAKKRINSHEVMFQVKTQLVNWLMNSMGKQELYDDYIDGYHFTAEVEKAPQVEENWIDGTVDVTFLCYPFMISDFFEGDDIWDTFDFEFGVSQMTSFGPFSIPIISDFKPLKVNDRIALTPWTTFTNNFPTKYLTEYYTVTDIHKEATDTTSQQVLVKELPGQALAAENILQALPYMSVELINSNSTAVLPEITRQLSGTGWYQIAIEQDGIIHYFMKDQKNTTLRLKPGINRLKIWAFGLIVSFQWHKEIL